MVAVAGLGGVVPAHAVESVTDTTSVAAGTGIVCNSNWLGTLCMDPQFNGYKISYYNHSGSPQWVDFNAHCLDGTWFGDDGAFLSESGTTRVYVFYTSLNPHGGCSGRLIYGGEVALQTPYAHP